MSENPQDVLLVISTLGFAEESGAYAVDRAAAAPGVTLHLLLVCENERESIADRLSEESWMGDRVGSELSQALSKDRRTRGYRVLSGISRDAAEEEVPTQTHVVDGELEEAVRRFTQEHPLAEVIVCLPAPGLLGRLLPGRKDADCRLERSLGLPVKIFRYE